MSGDEGTRISYAEPGEAAAAFQRIRISTAPYTEAIWRLRDAIDAANFWVLQEINSEMLLKRAGYAPVPARQILFFHPRFMARILEADPAAVLEAPLKIAILELADGTVQMRWTDPVLAFARYGSQALSDLGHELGAACEEIALASNNGIGSV